MMALLGPTDAEGKFMRLSSHLILKLSLLIGMTTSSLVHADVPLDANGLKSYFQCLRSFCGDGHKSGGSCIADEEKGLVITSDDAGTEYYVADANGVYYVGAKTLSQKPRPKTALMLRFQMPNQTYVVRDDGAHVGLIGPMKFMGPANYLPESDLAVYDHFDIELKYPVYDWKNVNDYILTATSLAVQRSFYEFAFDLSFSYKISASEFDAIKLKHLNKLAACDAAAKLENDFYFADTLQRAKDKIHSLTWTPVNQD